MSALSAITPEDACTLCGAALPARPVPGAGESRFCCAGCAHVASIVEAMGEGSEEAKRVLSAAKGHGLLSAAEATLRPVPTIEVPEEARGVERQRVRGLACPSCAWLVEEVVRSVKGVAAVQVDFLTDTVECVYDLRFSSPDAIESAVREAGYGLERIGDESKSSRVELYRFVLAAVVAMNLMTLAIVGYDAHLRGAEFTFWDRALSWIQVVCAIPVVTWCGMPIYRRAFAAARLGRVVMETLLSLGIIAASALSMVAVLTDANHLYLETATVLVFLALAGRHLELHFKTKASKALTDLLKFDPTKARRVEDGRFAPLEDFQVGDAIRVEVGEITPLDVHLTEPTVVSETLLTGEPHPVKRAAGEMALAGCTAEKTLIGTVARVKGDCMADTMRARVEESLRRTESGSRLADRIAQGFVPVVVLVAIASFGAHLWGGAGFATSILTAVSVLVVACPCAFGLAASLALSLAVLRLAKTGVLVKDPSVLESVPRVDVSAFDKTGTLTVGDLRLAQISGDDSLHGQIASLEAHSKHPVGMAIARLLHAEPMDVESVVETPGLGITGTVNGQRIAVGRAELFSTVSESDAVDPGHTRVWYGVAGEPAMGLIDLADRLRDETPEVIRDLQAMGIESYVLSGDAPATTQTIATQAGIAKAEGGLMPEAKAQRLAALRAAGHTVMYVGDGFNDADALAGADVGVAMASGADLALLSAPVVVTRADLRGVKDFVDIARRSVRVMRGNLVWAFAYNVALIPVAAFGWLQPVYAAVLMAVSSLSVVLHSLRVRTGFTPGHV